MSKSVTYTESNWPFVCIGDPHYPVEAINCPYCRNEECAHCEPDEVCTHNVIDRHPLEAVH